MASDRTWSYIHRKYSWVFLVTAILLAVMGADLVFSCILTRGVSRFDPTCLMVLWVPLAGLLVMVTVAAIRANSDAAEYNKRF